jgi:hypothetical protein
LNLNTVPFAGIASGSAVRARLSQKESFHRIGFQRHDSSEGAGMTADGALQPMADDVAYG